jgi:chromosome segregation ATPase
MEKKIKLILVGLIGIAAVFIFLFLQALSSKQTVMRERDDLAQQKETLSSEAQKLKSGMLDKEKKIDLLNKELAVVRKEKQDVEKKYELANKAKDELVEKLKFLQDQLSAKPEVEVALPPTTDAYWAGILKSKTDLEFQLAQIRNDLKSTQINNEQLQRDKKTLELEFNNLKREKEDLKRQFDYNQKLVDSLSQDLVREKNDKNKMQETFSSLRSENGLFLQQIKSLSNRKITLEHKLQALQEKKANLELKFNQMQVMLSDKLSQIGNLNQQLTDIATEEKPKKGLPLEKRESVELPAIVVRPQSEITQYESTPLEAKISAVNRENNFVVVELGEEAGVKVGNKLRVTRDGQYVGEVEVIQTRKNISACDIKKEIIPIQIGDSVLK